MAQVVPPAGLLLAAPSGIAAVQLPPQQPREQRQPEAHEQHRRDGEEELEPRPVDDHIAGQMKQMELLQPGPEEPHEDAKPPEHDEHPIHSGSRRVAGHGYSRISKLLVETTWPSTTVATEKCPTPSAPAGRCVQTVYGVRLKCNCFLLLDTSRSSWYQRHSTL